MIRLFVFLLGLVLAASVGAQPDMFPKSAPPEFRVVSNVDAAKGTARFIISEARPVIETRVVKRLVDGKEVLVQQEVTRMVQVQKEIELDLKSFEIQTGKGKNLTLAEAAPRMKGQVILMADQNGLDPLYSKVLARDAIVLVPRKSK